MANVFINIYLSIYNIHLLLVRPSWFYLELEIFLMIFEYPFQYLDRHITLPNCILISLVNCDIESSCNLAPVLSDG